MFTIEVSELSKSIDGSRMAVDGVSYCIRKGEIFGFLAPNGSGKTTCVRL